MILFGIKEQQTGFKVVAGHTCGNCASRESLFVRGSRKSFCLSGIRLFTLSRKICTVCAHCQNQLEVYQMPPDLRKNALSAARAAFSNRFSICILLFQVLISMAVVTYHQ